MLIALFISTAHGQTNKYSLTDLVEASKKYLPSLLQKQALISSDLAKVTEVRHSFLTKLYVGDKVSIGTDNSMAGSYLPVIVPSVVIIVSTSCQIMNLDIDQKTTILLVLLIPCLLAVVIFCIWWLIKSREKTIRRGMIKEIYCIWF